MPVCVRWTASAPAVASLSHSLETFEDDVERAHERPNIGCMNEGIP